MDIIKIIQETATWIEKVNCWILDTQREEKIALDLQHAILMSFDIYFYKRKSAVLTEEQVAQYLTDNLTFNNSDLPNQWDYENPETGVYFVIDWNEPDIDVDDIEAFNSFTEFESLNFSVSINFCRPTYFAFEVFPIIEKCINELDLYILNPQDDVDSESPRKFPPGYIQQQWIRHNSELIKQNFEKMNFKYLPIETSNAIWSFQFIREKLQNSLDEDIFVAGIILLESKQEKKLYTVCVWPEHIPVILPVVDFVIIRKKYTRFFRKIEESGIVSYNEIIDKLGNSFEDFEYQGLHLKMIKQRSADEIVKKFNRLPIIQAAVEFGTNVGLDGFVNYRA